MSIGSPDYSRVMRTAAWMWIIYLTSLAAINLSIYSGKPAGGILGYHLVNTLPALIFMGLAYSKWIKSNGRIMPVLMILLISVVPILMNHLLNLRLPPAPLSNLEGMALRQLPISMIGLVLVAWQYRLFVMVLYSIAINLFELLVVFALNKLADPRFVDFYFIVLIRTICFLVVGVFIGQLITYLRAQQASLKLANKQLAHYASALEGLTVSRERNRMSRELHDTVVHTLSGLSVQLETIKAYWEVDAVTSRNLLDQSLETTRSGLQETRRALKELRARPLDDLGLVLALRKLIDQAAQRGKLGVDVCLPDQELFLSPDVEQCIYRIAQEALENVVHHAAAHNIIVKLTLNEGEILLTLRDDGHGFNPETHSSAGHFGLDGMRERARLVGGELSITSQPNCGAAIRLAIKGYQR